MGTWGFDSSLKQHDQNKYGVLLEKFTYNQEMSKHTYKHELSKQKIVNCQKI